MTQSNATGHCACGAVTFRVTGRLTDVVVCHCTTCRRVSGYYWAATHADRSALIVDCGDTLRWWASSDFAERAFCSRCGSSLFYRRHDAPDVAIAPGALDGPTGLKTTAHICCAEAGDYYDLFGGFSGDISKYAGPSIDGG